MNTPMKRSADGRDANRDPISGAPGSHPVGTGVGALGGAAAGAAIGTAAGGPVGTVVGGAVGAVVGGLAGKGVAEAIDPTQELNHWRNNFADRPYARDSKFADYEPAYRYGVSSFGKHRGKSFDEVETQLSRDWSNERGTSSMNWERAKYATRDAWDRLSDATERAIPGDSDNDGK